MDGIKRKELIERIKMPGLPSPDSPCPLVTLEEFFIGNDDYGSIGCNLTPMLSPQFFFEKLKFIRSQPNVQEVLIEVTEVEENDPAVWPFSDRAYVFPFALNWLASPFLSERFSAPEISVGENCASVLGDCQSAVDTLLEIKRGEITEKKDATPAIPATPAPKHPVLKRYRNE